MDLRVLLEEVDNTSVSEDLIGVLHLLPLCPLLLSS